MARTKLQVLYAQKAYQKKMIELYMLKSERATKPGYKAYYRDRAKYHARKHNALDKKINKMEE